ncbi:MAG: lipid-binding SYLF domain-containing protein [Desulfovibrionaceae bacterium]|nr:lipid-binding SYLF domain-containing protein [Desulfovibrionaceae bacterium]
MIRRFAKPLLLLACLAAFGLAAFGCGRAGPHPVADPGPGQRLVDRAVSALRELEARDREGFFDLLFQEARGLFVFPSLVRAGYFFGLQAGSGVLCLRDEIGFWSEPAFFGLGSASLGLQIGVQEATVFVFLMSEEAVKAALDGSLALGVDADMAVLSADVVAKAAPFVPDPGEVYVFADLGGLFAGVSLQGGGLCPASGMNRAYYGPKATVRSILVERSYYLRPGTTIFKQELLRAGLGRR